MSAPFHRRDFVGRLVARSLAEFADDRCPQQAAAIAYHVLFSLFPLAIFVAGASSLILHATNSRSHAIGSIIGQLPLSASGDEQIRKLLLGATGRTAGFGLIAIVGLIYAASGMMTALRNALNQAWDVDEPRPFLKGKLIDLGMVIAVATLGLGSLALTVVARSANAALPGWVSLAAGVLIPLALVFGVTLFLYRVVPAADVRTADAWPAAAVVAVLVVALQNLFAIYVGNFGHYNAIYGSLGAVIAFMFFVYLAAQVLLLGAEIASEWPKVAMALRQGVTVRSDTPLFTQLKHGLRALWVHNPEDIVRAQAAAGVQPELEADPAQMESGSAEVGPGSHTSRRPSK